MKLPTPILLHLASAALLGLAAWTVSLMVPLYKQGAQDARQKVGMESAKDRLAKGRGQGPTTADWVYSSTSAAWWAGLTQVNLIGKLPPPPPPKPGETGDGPSGPVVTKIDLRPLDEVIELVSLMHDGKEGGKGGSSHVILRFKPEANIEPPEWWIRENTPPPPSSPGTSGSRDVVPPPRSNPANQKPSTVPTTPPPAGSGARPPGRPVGSVPMALGSAERVQKVWVQDDGDPRRSSYLWPIKSMDGREVGRVRLVRVAPDAQSAFFVRELSPLKAGEPAPEPKEEELLKTTMNIPQDVLAEMRRLQGRPGPVAQPSGAQGLGAGSGSWIDQKETTRTGNRFNLGRDDEARFRERSDELFELMDVDTYVSKTSQLRGLYVRNVDPQLASKFGVATGDVLLEVNNKKVESKAQAIQAGKTDYNRGVRTFTTKWLTSTGQIIERTYQAPDR